MPPLSAGTSTNLPILCSARLNRLAKSKHLRSSLSRKERHLVTWRHGEWDLHAEKRRIHPY